MSVVPRRRTSPTRPLPMKSRLSLAVGGLAPAASILLAVMDAPAARLKRSKLADRRAAASSCLGAVAPVGKLDVGMRRKHRAADLERRVERELIVAQAFGAGRHANENHLR